MTPRTFDIGHRVIFTDDGGNRHRGRITAADGPYRAIAADSGKRYPAVHARRILRGTEDKVLYLEARLDRRMQTDRVYGRMMRQWLAAYDVRTFAERVHTAEDLAHFLKRVRNPDYRFVTIASHGTARPSATLHLTFEKVRLIDRLDLFENNLSGKVLIFSACSIGRDQKTLAAIKRAGGAAAVIAYTEDIPDSYTNLVEVLLYDRLLRTNLRPAAILSRVQGALAASGIRPEGFRRDCLICV